VCERVGRTEEVLAWAAVEHRLERQPVLGEVDAADERRCHRGLVGVEDELLVADRQPALEPAGGVEIEVHASLHRCHEADRALVRGLVVGDLRGREVDATSEGDAETPGEGGYDEVDQMWLWGPERRLPRLNRHRRRE